MKYFVECCGCDYRNGKTRLTQKVLSYSNKSIKGYCLGFRRERRGYGTELAEEPWKGVNMGLGVENSVKSGRESDISGLRK